MLVSTGLLEDTGACGVYVAEKLKEENCPISYCFLVRTATGLPRGMKSDVADSLAINPFY